jgi:DNA-binding MarR family transcriptional regulator
LVTRNYDTADRRVVLLEPTLKGTRAYRALVAERHAMLVSRLNRITQKSDSS